MYDDCKLPGWALKSEYFCTMLHELRKDVSYRAIVDQIVDVPERADTRDTEAVKRIATAYLKLLFPNVRSAQDNMDEWQNMFSELPSLFQESALVDRIHGFIKGWDIPRMNDDLKLSGWALNSEYFCTILHELRNDVSYRAIVDQIVDVPDKADTRDTEAVKRIATAYLKLLFPNVRSAQDINPKRFQQYCLRPAVRMRKIIKRQLGILDVEFKGKDVPSFSLKEISYEN